MQQGSKAFPKFLRCQRAARSGLPHVEILQAVSEGAHARFIARNPFLDRRAAFRILRQVLPLREVFLVVFRGGLKGGFVRRNSQKRIDLAQCSVRLRDQGFVLDRHGVA